MLTEMVEYGHKIEEKVKTMKSEIKENVQGTNSDGKEIKDQKEEINIQPKQNEETKKQKNIRNGLGTYGTNLNVPTSKS